MTSWRDFARKLEPNESERANSAISANSPADGAETGPNGTNGTNGTAPLPVDLVAGIRRLKSMGCPRGIKTPAWAEVVRDALALADNGSAAQALSLGWSPADLFGAVTDPNSDSEADGLAVKLNGRRVLALCASFATVESGELGRAFIYRRTNDGARLLWALSRR